MTLNRFHYVLAAVLFCAAVSVADCRRRRMADEPAAATELSSSGKPLLKPPPRRSFKTVLSVDSGGVRGIIGARVLIELEESIKRHFLNNPSLIPSDFEVGTAEDFDVSLVDYFDCMTGVSSGGWSTLYLGTRGGKGASRMVLDDPAIVEQYGVIHDGGAQALLVLYREYSSIIFPVQNLDTDAGDPLDIANPEAPGVLTPLHQLDGLERTLEAFLGETTLADLDTSYLLPALDLTTQNTIYFVQNTFREMPVTASAVLQTRTTARSAPRRGGFESDFIFDEGKDYLLKDIGTAASAIPPVFPAKEISPIGSDEVEFLLIDGVLPVETTTLPATLFVAAETGEHDVEKIALLSVGTGLPISELVPFANAGIGGWLTNGTLLNLLTTTGQESLTTLIDYLYYSNPAVMPYQYLRIQTSAPVSTPEGMALSVVDQPILLDVLDAIALAVVEEYRESIDAFVSSFMFG